MKIIRDLDELAIDSHSVVTIGTFDGVHLGHQKIISKVIEDAKKTKWVSILFTFEPHPQVVLRTRPEKLYLLTTLNEKLEIIQDFELDYVVVQQFDEAFSQLEYNEFIERILLDKLHMKKMVLGYDAALGKKRKGTLDKITEHAKLFQYELDVVSPITIGDIIVNSTLIREYIRNGFMEKAAKGLGRLYSVKGLVVRGDQRGKKLGYPTANILIEHPMKLLPPTGVYAVDIDVRGKRYKGMMNLGMRPTFNDNHSNSFIPEVHIFDFQEDIYNEQIKIYFKKFIRTEKKFSSIEELVNQLKVDEKKCRKIDLVK